MRTITLYTRPGCHLCEQAACLLARVSRGRDISVTPVNIDTDPALAERYGIRVPVALINGEELDWPFTEREARAALESGAGGES